jgi:hypothetical protein
MGICQQQQKKKKEEDEETMTSDVGPVKPVFPAGGLLQT